MSTSWRTSPLPKGWKAIVERIKKRDPWCVMCLEVGKHTPTYTADHIGRNDVHEDWNLRGLCKWHHGKRTSAQANAARKRVSQKRPPEKHPGLRE